MMCNFMDNSQSNITPRLCTVWTQQMTHQLDVPQSQCVTVGDRAFAVAGARIWSSLPPDIVASNTLSQFRCQLKTFLFKQSYHSVLLS